MTTTGLNALEAAVIYLATKVSDWGLRVNLRGTQRNARTNYEALAALLQVIRGRSLEALWTDTNSSVRLQDLELYSDDNSDTGIGLCLIIGNGSFELRSARIREAKPQFWEISDGHADSMVIALNRDAPFNDAEWEIDEWDLPGPVLPLDLTEADILGFIPQAAALAALVTDHSPRDRHRAEAAITKHWQLCLGNRTPAIRWFTDPHAALSALQEADSLSGGRRNELRDRALRPFEEEITVRLGGRSSLLLDCATRCWPRNPLRSALSSLAAANYTPAAFDYLGLAADGDSLSWLSILLESGVELPPTVTSFVNMTRDVWLFYAGTCTAFAVDAPIAVEGDALRFAGSGRLLKIE